MSIGSPGIVGGSTCRLSFGEANVTSPMQMNSFPDPRENGRPETNPKALIPKREHLTLSQSPGRI